MLLRKLCCWFLLNLLIVIPVQAQDEESVQRSAGVSSVYIDLKPPFVANYGGVPSGRLKYLKADISLRVESGGEQAVMHHMPAIRHHLLMLLSRQSEDKVISMQGKEQLRQQAMEEVRRVITEEDGDSKVIDLLFNSFIVQR